MLEFKVTLDTDNDVLKITGPTDLNLMNKVYSIEDMCELFRTYLLRFCRQVHFDNYRIDKTKMNYQLSKDIKGTRSEWIYVSTHDTYFDAFEELCYAKYRNKQCLAGYTDCIWNKDTNYYNKERCKECVAQNGCYYNDEDK